MKKKALIFSLISCMFYLGCSGRTPNPVLYYMPGDDALGCEEIKIQMAEIKREIALKGPKIKERDARNLWLSLCWPIGSPFEKDILNAEEIEIQALNARYSSLFMIAGKKGDCVVNGFSPEILGKSQDNEFPLLCTYCGPKVSKEWRIVDGKIMCSDCYKTHLSK